MTRSEIEEISEEAAVKALTRFFLTLGVNLSDPDAVVKLQEDLRHIRRWREATETAKAHAFKTAIGVIVTGALGWLGLVLWKHQ
jgi:hypothetical protein